MPNGYSTRVVATSLAMTLFGESKGLVWTTFPEMIVYRSHQVSEAGGARFVGFPFLTVLARGHVCKER
jgi:hypothetical protein